MTTPTVRRRQDDRSAQSRQRILDTIRSMCIAQEVTELSLTEICATSGMTTGALYFHFGNKDNAVEAAIVEVIRGRYTNLRTVDENQSLAALIEAVVDAVTRVHVESGKLPRAVQAIINTRPGAYDAWLDSRTPVIDALTLAVGRERERIDLSKAPSSYFAHFILNSIEDIAMDVFQWRNPNLSPFAADLAQWKLRQVALWVWAIRSPDLD